MNCLECNERLVGRSDKKFCNDGCRNSYNNKHNKDSSNLMRTINAQLRRNYRILERYPKTDGIAMSTLPKLSDEGFDFGLITAFKIHMTGAELKVLYDLGYEILDLGVVKIFETKRYR